MPTAVAPPHQNPEAAMNDETTRDCTRCDGTQHLLGASNDFGLYVCDTCELRVGFDLLGIPLSTRSGGFSAIPHREFLIATGTPARYTKPLRGPRLSSAELRI